MIEQLLEEAPQQVVAPSLRRGADPFGDGLNSLSALAVARTSKEDAVKPREYPSQCRGRVDVRFPVHALAAHEFVPIIISATVDVEHSAVCARPAVQFGIRGTGAAHTGAGTDHELSNPHHAIRVVIHFNHEDRGCCGGRSLGDVGG